MRRADLTVTEIAHRLGKPHTTIHRWLNDGLQVGGLVVKLRGRRIGHMWSVTEDGLAEFLAACNKRGDDSPVPESVTERSRRAAKAVERARRALAGEGC